MSLIIGPNRFNPKKVAWDWNDLPYHMLLNVQKHPVCSLTYKYGMDNLPDIHIVVSKPSRDYQFSTLLDSCLLWKDCEIMQYFKYWGSQRKSNGVIYSHHGLTGRGGKNIYLSVNLALRSKIFGQNAWFSTKLKKKHERKNNFIQFLLGSSP